MKSFSDKTNIGTYVTLKTVYIIRFYLLFLLTGIISVVGATQVYGQQSRSISGVVKNSQGETIIGANIVEKGTNNGTITNVDGLFTLRVSPNAVLKVSYMGYIEQEVSTRNKSKLEITMVEDARLIDEVVVLGYGSVKKRDLTGAVTSVKSAEVLAAPTSNVMEALQGKIPGMDITKTSGQVGGEVSILLRGSRSIYGNNEPLFIIDGIPGSYSQVNPSDIESVDVLKDASSTAIYGSAGANGVVIITTKRGKEEGLQVTVNSSTMFNAGYLKLPEVQTSYSSGKNGIYNDNSSYVWGAKLDVGNEAMQYNPYTQEREMTELTSRGKNNLKNFQELSFITNNNVSVTQKGKYGSIRTSLTHVYNKGQWPNEKLNKITYTVSGDMKYKKFSSEAGITYNKRFYPNMGGSAYHGTGYIYNLLVWSGSEYDIRDYKNYWRIKDEQSNWWDRGGWYDNPYYIANELTSSDNYDVVNAFVNASYDITSWLKLSLRSGADMYTEKSETKAPVGSVTGKGEKKGYYSVYQKRGFSTNNDIMLTAEHKFGDISVDGFVGGNIYYYQNDYLGSNTAGGLIIPGYYSLKASVDPAETSKTYNSKQTNSIYGKIGLAYKSAVFVEATGSPNSSKCPKLSTSGK